MRYPKHLTHLSLSLLLALSTCCFAACKPTKQVTPQTTSPTETPLNSSVTAEANNSDKSNANSLETSVANNSSSDSANAQAETNTEIVKSQANSQADLTFFMTPTKNAAYLKEYFDLDKQAYKDGTSWLSALAKVSGDADFHAQTSESYKALGAAIKNNFSKEQLLESIVAAAGLDELAQTYTAAKAAKRLAAIYRGNDYSETGLKYFATAYDSGLLSEAACQFFNTAQSEKLTELSADLATDLLMHVAQISGTGRNYLGLSSDYSIGNKVLAQWNSFIINNNHDLMELGKNAVQAKVITGFNVKQAAFAPRFLNDTTLVYGHSDIKHVYQLLKLLRSEDCQVLVAFEPKVSIYQYLTEWGPIPEATPTYRVDKYDQDFYLVSALEYDLALEFKDKADLDRFDSLIKQYAKKSSEDDTSSKLLYQSWWQPLYSGTATDLSADYGALIDCQVEHDNYSLHTFCMPDQAAKVVDYLQKHGKADYSYQQTKRFADQAFIHYLSGTDYQ